MLLKHNQTKERVDRVIWHLIGQGGFPSWLVVG
jgi:hypothetical protein